MRNLYGVRAGRKTINNRLVARGYRVRRLLRKTPLTAYHRWMRLAGAQRWRNLTVAQWQHTINIGRCLMKSVFPDFRRETVGYFLDFHDFPRNSTSMIILIKKIRLNTLQTHIFSCTVYTLPYHTYRNWTKPRKLVNLGCNNHFL